MNLKLWEMMEIIYPEDPSTHTCMHIYITTNEILNVAENATEWDSTSSDTYTQYKQPLWALAGSIL